MRQKPPAGLYTIIEAGMPPSDPSVCESDCIFYKKKYLIACPCRTVRDHRHCSIRTATKSNVDTSLEKKKSKSSCKCIFLGMYYKTIVTPLQEKKSKEKLYVTQVIWLSFSLEFFGRPIPSVQPNFFFCFAESDIWASFFWFPRSFVFFLPLSLFSSRWVSFRLSPL